MIATDCSTRIDYRHVQKYLNCYLPSSSRTKLLCVALLDDHEQISD